ncbi:MAG: 30S ribosomal protein S20 [Candidatus Hepatoplasma vulgare]|nr:MAG: 30S ribosomal protein S20 [Candidatus Hepatoplasma sp.]
MANIKSNEKRKRQDDKRNLKNKSKKNEIKTAMKKAQTSKSTIDINNAIKLIDKAASAGIIHDNKASRYVSRVHKIKTEEK